VVSFTPLPLYPRGKSPRYPLYRTLGELQSRSGQRGEEKILDPTMTRSPTPRSQSLYRLRYPGSFILQLIRLKFYVHSSSMPGVLYALTTCLIIIIAFDEEYKFLFMQFSPSLSYFLSQIRIIFPELCFHIHLIRILPLGLNTAFHTIIKQHVK
jgi:hypothetical protein